VGPTLSPTQQKARKALVAAIARPGLSALAADSGMGRTTILGTLGADHETARLDVRDFMAALGRHHPLALEETWHEIVTAALANAQLVLFDDFQLILNVCAMGHEYLRVHQLTTNVDLGEVEAVEVDQLKGVDGRAFAHRLKSKFFLIDGTVVGGTPNFFATVHRIFEAAKHNAPSIVFIDDSDVLFEDGSDHGFYRYLLTMLDGIESESAGRVCLMMTAMDVASLPPALLGYDRARRKPQRPAVEYFLQAVESVRANKQRYAAASVRGRMGARGKNIPPMVFQQMARAMESGGGAMIDGVFGVDTGGDEP
jgi:hypothetical protein